MNQKELTKPFTMILNWKKTFGFDAFLQNILQIFNFLMVRRES